MIVNFITVCSQYTIHVDSKLSFEKILNNIYKETLLENKTIFFNISYKIENKQMIFTILEGYEDLDGCLYHYERNKDNIYLLTTIYTKIQRSIHSKHDTFTNLLTILPNTEQNLNIFNSI